MFNIEKDGVALWRERSVRSGLRIAFGALQWSGARGGGEESLYVRGSIYGGGKEDVGTIGDAADFLVAALTLYEELLALHISSGHFRA